VTASAKVAVASVLAIVVLLYGSVRVAVNVQAEHSPPAMCQLFGGSWNFWNGWRCG